MTIGRAAAFVLALAASGCYDFDFPLDPKPTVPSDPKLVGAWKCLPAEPDLDDAPGTLLIERRTDTTARWTLASLSSDGSTEKSAYDVHASSVRSGSLLNALEIGDKANGKWMIVRYSFFTPNVLRLQIVHDEPFASVVDAKALRAAIEKRIDDSDVYADLLVCVRSKAVSSPPSSPSPVPSASPRH